ncbi:hypothetical protein E1B28_013591 [Marasmius oreades]|uniref:Uncharacterized protein n=1 Tax=Marasmius oreades TaxID=181124 RepID=A0A9P7RRB6_9AGAR|nr:uncharacterized protein E1B28_013591 [Marasmius oreades]KAG7087643.1 hypothetical protein E1B28_013591 [Marasmius oreades]
MKFFTLALAALLPAAVLAQEPTFYTGNPVARAAEPALEKRSITANVKVDGLRYRTCPRTECTAMGQYPINTQIQIDCYTATGTTTVEGNPGWGRLTSGYWVALAYVGWNGEPSSSASAPN